jgi:hypothetical protein
MPYTFPVHPTNVQPTSVMIIQPESPPKCGLCHGYHGPEAIPRSPIPITLNTIKLRGPHRLVSSHLYPFVHMFAARQSLSAYFCSFETHSWTCQEVGCTVDKVNTRAPGDAIVMDLQDWPWFPVFQTWMLINMSSSWKWQCYDHYGIWLWSRNLTYASPIYSENPPKQTQRFNSWCPSPIHPGFLVRGHQSPSALQSCHGAWYQACYHP